MTFLGFFRLFSPCPVFGYLPLFLVLFMYGDYTGYCDERHGMILVYEFMENGTLRDPLYNWNEDCTMSIPWSQLSWEVWLKIRCTMVSMFMWRIWRCQQRKINWREIIHPRKWMNLKEIDLSWVFNPFPGYGELISYLRTLLSVLSPFAECPPAHPLIMKRCRESPWLENHTL